MSDKFKVKLISSVDRKDFVIFKVTPELSESRNINYKNLDPIHMPGNIQTYGNSSSRSFNLTAKFISRTIKEANQNSKDLQLIKSWGLPYFGISGNSTSNQAQIEKNRRDRRSNLESTPGDPNAREFNNTRSLLGAPPDVLLLSAYSDPNAPIKTRFTSNINKIPVVLSQISNSYSSEVDYIPTSTGEPFPVFMSVELILLETHSPSEYSKFSLSDFKSGRLNGF